MPVEETDTHDLPKCNIGIGVVGAGSSSAIATWWPTRMPGSASPGSPRGPSSRARGRRSAAIPKVYPSLEEMLDDPAIEVVDVAVPPNAQPAVIRRILAHPRRMRGILAQKPLAMSYAEAATIVNTCELAGVVLQVNQNMRYDPSVRALKTLLDRGELGRPVLATIELRRSPTGCPGRERAVPLHVRHEHPSPGHIPILARRSAPGAGEHASRSENPVPPRRRNQFIYPRV